MKLDRATNPTSHDQEPSLHEAVLTKTTGHEEKHG